MYRVILPALAGFAFVVGASHGGDLRDQAAKQEIAKQKITAEVRDAVERSRKMDATQAKFLLNTMLRAVKDSRDLLERERTPLVQQLQIRLRQAEEAGRAKAIVDEQRPLRDPPKFKPTPIIDGPGSGVTDMANRFIEPGRTTAQLHADLIRQREKNLLALKLGVEKDPPIPTGDSNTAFPKYWKELTEQRKKMVGPQLTKKEIALLKTLNSVMSVDYNSDKFKAVLNHLQDKTGLTLIVDPNSERDLNLDYDDVVTLRIQKASVRTILKKVLGDKGLTYIIKEGNIQVMTPKRASEQTIIRSYPVDDLIAPNQMALMFGPFVQQAQMMQNAQQLINLIQLTIEPAYWQPNGPGSIVFYPPTKSLLIRASAEMHYQMAAPGLFGR